MGYDFENEAPETRKWRLALNSLTPGGSEFADDPERCVAFVKRARTLEHDGMLMWAKRAKAAEALVEEYRKSPIYQMEKELREAKHACLESENQKGGEDKKRR